jgi:general secretion pathway protein M
MMLKEWFQKLAPREQLLVGIAAILTTITLVVTLGVRPIISNSVKGQELVSDKRELLNEIERVAALVGPQTGSSRVTPGAGNQSLVVIVDRTTRGNGLAPYLKRNQPDGANSIKLRFEGAPFDVVIAWLGNMKDQHGLLTTAANIDKSGTPGRINCNLTLSRGGR